MEAWFQDARFALRLLRKSPLFTVTAALSLAIGIGANATVFSVASALLLRPLPGIPEQAGLVDIGRNRGNGDFDTVSYPNYQDVRDRSTSFVGVYAHQIEPTPLSLGGQGQAERIYGALVSGNYFETLGVRPHLGRLLRSDDDAAPGGSAIVVLSHELWMRRFGGDSAVVGQAVHINGFPFTVAGVTTRGFQGTTLLKPDIWLPLSMMTQAMPSRRETLFTSRGATWLFMGARLKNDVTIAQANAELESIALALEREYPRTNDKMRFRAQPAAAVPGLTTIVAGFVGVLMGIVTLLLLIACSNLAGMLLARGASRRREIAVRMAIGAAQGRIIRQLLTETAVLFAIGAVCGLVLSRWLSALLLSLLPQLPMPLFVELTTDWRVIAFTAVTALVAAVLSGLAPALQARRTNLVPALRTDGFDGRGSRLRLRNVFVVTQVTLSLVLVVSAGLFLRALVHAASMPTGFDQRHVDVVTLDLSLARYDRTTGRPFARDLLERARALPGVESVALTVDLPLDGSSMGFGRLGLPGEAANQGIAADWNIVEPGFFRTLGMGIVRGRDFTEHDETGAPPVIIVNEAFARRAWGNGDPIGQRLETDAFGERGLVTVVGVAADARVQSIGEPAQPYVLVPFGQLYHERINVLVKTRGPSAIPEVRRLVRTMNPNLPVSEALPLSEITALGTTPQRIAAAISGVLGIVGLLLAAMGIYGVTSYAVARRTREIGIRIALGAEHDRVLRLILRQGVTLAAIGILFGAVLSAVAGQLVGSLLLGVEPLDPLTFVAAGVLFGLVSLAATYVPARRALRVDPMVALRQE